jgi:hypothetical protein
MAQTRSTFAIDAQLRKIAAPQLGLVTSAQALKTGLDYHVLSRRRLDGALVSVFPGVSRLSAVAPTPQQRILAASLIVRGSVVAGLSAAIVHEMPLPRALLAASSDVVLTVGPSRWVRIKGIHAIRLDRPLRSQVWMTTRIATPAATLVLLAPHVDALTLERCVDHGLAEQTLSVASVLTQLKRVPERVVGDSAVLRRLLADRADGAVRHRSGLEQTVGGWLDDAGLGGWVPNYSVSVGDDGEVEVDFGWVGPRVALEVSPFYTHGARVKQDRDADRRRLLTQVGWRFVEARDEHLVDQRSFATIVDSLRSLMSAAAAA